MSKIIKHSAVFGIGNIISRSIAVLLVPLYTRNMTVSEFGIFSAGLTLYIVLNIIMKGGAPAAMLKIYVENKENRGQVLFVTYSYTLLTSLLIGLVSFALSGSFIDWLIGAGNFATYAIIILSSFAEAMIEVPLNVFRAKEQSRIFAVFSIIGSILTLAFSYMFIVILKMRINGAFLAMFLAKGIVFLLCSIFLVKDFSFKWNRSIASEIFQLGTPIVISGLSLWLINMSDRLIITNMRGGYEAGLYSLGNRIGTLLNIIILTPFSLVWGVESMKIYYNSKNKKDRFASFFIRVTGLCLIVGIFLSLFVKEMILIFATREYMKSLIIVPVISLSNILYVMYYFHTFYFMIIKKTYLLTFIIASGAALNIALNISLLKFFDYRIVSCTNLVAMLLIYLAILKSTSGRLPFDHSFKKVAFGFVLFVLSAAIGLIENMIYPIVLKFVVFAITLFFILKVFKLDSIVYPIFKKLKKSKA